MSRATFFSQWPHACHLGATSLIFWTIPYLHLYLRHLALKLANRRQARCSESGCWSRQHLDPDPFLRDTCERHLERASDSFDLPFFLSLPKAHPPLSLTHVWVSLLLGLPLIQTFPFMLVLWNLISVEVHGCFLVTVKISACFCSCTRNQEQGLFLRREVIRKIIAKDRVLVTWTLRNIARNFLCITETSIGNSVSDEFNLLKNQQNLSLI